MKCLVFRNQSSSCKFLLVSSTFSAWVLSLIAPFIVGNYSVYVYISNFLAHDNDFPAF